MLTNLEWCFNGGRRATFITAGEKKKLNVRQDRPKYERGNHFLTQSSTKSLKSEPSAGIWVLFMASKFPWSPDLRDLKQLLRGM
jgi:hypothetical protein